MKRKLKLILNVFIVLIVVMLVTFLIYANFKIPPYITNIEITDSKRFEDQVIFNVEVANYFFKYNKNTWCSLIKEDEKISDANVAWIKAVNGYCSFTVQSGNYNVFVKDSYGNINDIESQKVTINKLLDIKVNKDTIYMWKGRSETLKYELSTIGELKTEVTWKSDNDNIATVDNYGNVVGVDYGETYVRAISSEGKSRAVKVIVTNLIRKPVIDFNKSYIKCKQFSETEANMVDSILFDRVDSAGYQTRAGVIAAARFLALEFSYRIPYFAENGRLKNYAPYKHVDGEGRYYHRGLYLNENKFKDISSSFVGPCIWGCDLQTFTELPEFTYGKYYPNGLDCSGFVTWALLNGGFDIGDIGAGENAEHEDLDDLGTKVYITDELMNSGRVKVGDLIGLNGHMAILVGWDDSNYYIAESLNNTGGVVITTVSRNKLVHNSIYKYIILMDDVYKSDGNYTNMW